MKTTWLFLAVLSLLGTYVQSGPAQFDIMKPAIETNELSLDENFADREDEDEEDEDEFEEDEDEYEEAMDRIDLAVGASKAIKSHKGAGSTNYKSNENKKWTITTAQRGDFEISCETFLLKGSTDCAKDFLKFKSKNCDGKYDTIKTLCGDKTGKTFTVSGTTEVKIVFKTDGTNEDLGFKCTITAVAEECSSTCACGQSANKRIVGGEEAAKYEFPWVAALTYNTTDNIATVFCGGTVIAPEWVITTKTCAAFANFDNVLIGDYNLGLGNEHDVQQGFYSPEQVIFHSKADLALIKLTRSINFGPNNYGQICLQKPDACFAGFTATSIGWGLTTPTSAFGSFILRKVLLPVLYNNANNCKGNTKTVCAGGVTDTGICSGDEGHSLEVKICGQSVLIGIAQTPTNPCVDGIPDLYTRLAPYISWIQKKTTGTCVGG